MTRRHPITVTSMFALATMAGLATGCPDDSDSGTKRTPFRDDWEVVIDQDFIHLDGDGNPQISRLTIGGREYDDNFANRGDVIVNFDGAANHILVEFRKFTFSPSQEAAQADFDALSAWAYAGVSSPKPPGHKDLDVEDDCIASGWQSDCEVLVYYDGLSQLRRSGTDIRVTLPPDYRQRIDVVTQDNVEDDDYFNRGNVCIGNLFASANVQTESGNVWVRLNPETYPAPKCSPEEIADCESFMIDDGMGGMTSAPWAPECACMTVGGGEFGVLAIDNRADTASDITVDMPAELWASISAQNKGSVFRRMESEREASAAVIRAEGREQIVYGLELRYSMTDTSRTEHLEGAGDHDAAALRLQIQGRGRVQPFRDAPGWHQYGLIHGGSLNHAAG